MSKINKNRTPWILVVTSMILLFLFVGYWNISTYLRDKNKLAEDVEIQLQLAFTEVKDSELIYFIRTQLSDDEGGKEFPDSISIFFETDQTIPSLLSDSQSKIVQEISHSHSDQDSAIVVDVIYDTSHVYDFSKGFKGRELTVIASSKGGVINIDGFKTNGNDSSNASVRFKQINSWINSNDSLTTTFDTLLDHNCDSIFNPLSFFDKTPNSTNSSVDKTYTLFKEKLIENKLPDSFTIVTDPSTPAEGMRIKYKSSGFGFTDWSIDLKNYQLYLLKKMIPTLLFSLFLLGIISLAFWTLLTNWIKQNRLVQVKNEFINNMTHELKTPIATVGVALEAISSFDLEKEQDKTKEYIDISRNEIDRLSLLVDKVLNIAAFDSKEAVLKSESVDLSATIENIIQSMKLQFSDKNAQIVFNNKTANAIIIGDKLHLSNVVYNIIDNALKYCTAKPSIDINLSENTNKFILSFKDNGQGIPKEYQSKIFDRFFRVPSNDLHDVKGHGLGLNYVQNIIHAHSGEIAVESAENQGTTFTITLPKSISNV